MADTKNTEELDKKTQLLKDWIKSQQQLPTDLDEKLIRRFVHSCYCDLDRAKKAVETFCLIRTQIPELVNNRDPMSEQIKKTLSIINLAQIRLKRNRFLWIWQLNDPGLEKYDYVADAKIFFLSTDAWLLNEKDLEEEDIVLMDVKDLTLKFLTKFNMSIARKLSKYQEEGMPIRLKQIHLVNAPPFIDTIFGLVKSFVHPDIVKMIHVHTPKSDTLLKYFDKEELPEDYGGTNGTMEYHMMDTLNLIQSKREFFLNNDLWKSKNTKKNKSEATTEIGSFRTLAID